MILSLRTALNDAYADALEHAGDLIRENALDHDSGDQLDILRDEVNCALTQDREHAQIGPALCAAITTEAIRDALEAS